MAKKKAEGKSITTKLAAEAVKDAAAQSPPIRLGGRISREQEAFIRENLSELGWEAVAHAIHKSVQSLKDYCSRKGIVVNTGEGADYSERAIIKAELIMESFFPFIKEQLSASELEFFKEQYAAHILQFSKVSGIIFTEKMQIMHLVRNEIVLDRVFKRQKEFLEENEEIKKELKKYGQANTVEDLGRVKALKEIMQTNVASFASFSREAKELQDKINQLRESLNATRAQRTKDMKSVNTTFATYCAALDNETIRRQEGDYINIFRAAVEKERARLSKWHVYGDSEADIPFLTPETYKTILQRDEESTKIEAEKTAAFNREMERRNESGNPVQKSETDSEQE